MSGNQAELKAILSPTAALMIPGGQAVLTGAACGVIGGSLAGLLKWGDPLLAGSLTAGLGFSAGLLHGLSWWRGRVETIIGEVQLASVVNYPAETVRVEVAQNANSPYLWVDFLDLPVGRETMQLAAVDLASKNYQTSNLGGRGKALTRSQAEALRDYLIAKGLAYWIRPDAHTAGWELAAAGRSMIKQFAALPDGSPTPHQAPSLPEGWHSYPVMHTHTNTQTP